MPDQTDDTKLPPPSGDPQRAEGYVSQLLPLISENKLRVTHTDLSKFDPSSLHDHYSLDLQDYQIEISHSKQPTTGRDSYVLLFNNLKNITADQTQKEILAYLIISEEQFKKIKDVADEQIETLKKIEEEKRFKTAMTPVDQMLDKINKGEVDLSQTPQTVPDIKVPEHKVEQNDSPPPTTDQAPPIPPESVSAMPPGLEERPEPPTLPPLNTLEASKRDEAPIKSLSALALAAEAPLPEPTPPPAPAGSDLASTDTHLTQDQPQVFAAPIVEEIKQPEEAAPEMTAMQNPASQPLPAPTASIEEVQKALQEAYSKTPVALPQEPRPDLVHIAQHTNLTSAPLDATIDTTSSSNPQVTPQIDQAIDQAFKPTENAVLPQGAKTPEV